MVGEACHVITVTISADNRVQIPEWIPVSKRRLISNTVIGLVASRLIISYVSRRVSRAELGIIANNMIF